MTEKKEYSFEFKVPSWVFGLLAIALFYFWHVNLWICGAIIFFPNIIAFFAYALMGYAISKGIKNKTLKIEKLDNSIKV